MIEKKSGGSDRIPTGIPGLDDVLKGGVFEGGIYIVQGAPGAGKTIFGNQICFNQAARGARALYVTLLAENHSRMLAHMRRLEFYKEDLIPDHLSFVGAFQILEEEGLKGLLDLVRREVRARKAQFLVLDGLITVHEKASSDLELKKFIHELQTQAVFSGCTMFLLTSAFDASQNFPPEHTMVDGLIELQTRLHGRRAERQLQIHKLRGGGYLGGCHSFRIDDRGLVIFPRIEALLAQPTQPDRADGASISTGNAVLDGLLGGGLDRHSVSVVLGPAGSGKTTLGLEFLSALAENERGLLFGFYENSAALRLKARALNLPFCSLDERGRMDVIWRPATEARIDEIGLELLDAVKTGGIKRLFLDGVDAFRRLTDETDRVGAFLAALCNELRANGVTTLAAAETSLTGALPWLTFDSHTPTGLSPVAENIVLLRQVVFHSETHRLLTVLKARDRRIDMRVHRFEFGEGGVRIDPEHKSAEEILRDMSNSFVRGSIGRPGNDTDY
ncbi:MAG TPA: ATPase domain-containing protein [Xanthobacteraceae bacterium]|jgi:circadian clock protein KaiC|nr:ATPase domain-containing protein [Xanthobacteraceae bacterium]